MRSDLKHSSPVSISRSIRLLLTLLSAFSLPAYAAPPAQIRGTIVSIRGNILVIRPSLRPKLTRVSFSDKTVIFSYERASMSYLKPGMRIGMGGLYSETRGFTPFFIEAADHPIGYLAEKSHGLLIQQDRGWANAVGTLKSVQPLVFKDDDGKEYVAKIDRVRGVWRDLLSDRSSLLIGVRINAQGTLAPDGVIQATNITPDRNFSQAGTMFGQVIAVKGDRLLIRPRYTSDTLEVVCDPHCAVLKQISLDPDSIKVGDRVTFWGQQHNHTWDFPRSTDLLAIALMVGPHRYPSAQGDNGGVFLTGKIAALEPDVRLAADDGKTINILIPAQMPVARLEPIPLNHVQHGAQAMIVLTRHSDGRFHCTSLVLDASPWVGYGG